MAFCNSCGANIVPGTKFCNKCGAAVAGATASTGGTPVAPIPPKGGTGALKIVLIVVAVIVGIGILGIATVGIVAWRVAKSSHVSQEGNNVKVETPFGTVETSKDPEKAVQQMGIDIYPGALVQNQGAASTTFGSVHTVAASFETSDSVDKVCAFYKAKFPKAMVTTSQESHCTIVSNDKQNMVTINVEGSGDTTRFQITNVTRKDPSSN